MPSPHNWKVAEWGMAPKSHQDTWGLPRISSEHACVGGQYLSQHAQQGHCHLRHIALAPYRPSSKEAPLAVPSSSICLPGLWPTAGHREAQEGTEDSHPRQPRLGPARSSVSVCSGSRRALGDYGHVHLSQAPGPPRKVQLCRASRDTRAATSCHVGRDK